MRNGISRVAKRLAPVAILASVAVILSGCGTASEPTGEGIEGVHITFGGWGGEEDATKSFFQDFQTSFEDETGADVEWIGSPWADTQKQLALRASSDPIDVAQLDIGWITSFASQGQLVDLNEVYGKDTLESLYPASYLALGQRDGKQVALPWTMASISLVANMDILNAAGITKAPETTEDFREALEAIKESQPDVIPYALNTKTAASVSGFLQPWIWTFGGSLYDDGKVSIDKNSGAADALEYLTGLVDDGLVAKDMDVFTARTLFAEGKVAFYDDAIIARGLVTDPDISDSVMPIPRPVLKSGDAPQSTQWGHALVMFAKDRTDSQLEAAKEFFSWLQNPDVVGSYFADQGLLPATNAGLDAQDADEYGAAWADITATSRPKETDAFANGAQIAEIVGQHGEGVYNGIESADDAVDAIASELKQLK